MPADTRQKTTTLRDKSMPSSGTGERLSRWLLFSFLFHGALLIALVLSPYFPSRTRPAPPVYTVDLVGGEKIGGMRPGTELSPPAAAKEPPKKAAAEPAAPIREIKKEAPNAKEKAPNIEKSQKIQRVEKAEKLEKAVKPVTKFPPADDGWALKTPVKKEPEKTIPAKEVKDTQATKVETKETKVETASEQTSTDSLDKVRERLIQSALDRVKSRAESSQKSAAMSKTGDVLSVGPGQGDGAAALGQGGRGGGSVVKGAEFVMYQTKIVSMIKANWAWPGQKGNLKALVRFGIKDNGEITGIKISEPSGDPSFDESVLRALRKSSPLPAPPEAYRQDFAQVEMNFQP